EHAIHNHTNPHPVITTHTESPNEDFPPTCLYPQLSIRGQDESESFGKKGCPCNSTLGLTELRHGLLQPILSRPIFLSWPSHLP
ncbi:unnamed protein product, partial [Pleuronectes platessa]